MTLRGRVKDGQILLDEPAVLPEGAEVKVEIISGTATIWQKLRSVAGTIPGPADWAENHDHYIHGTPKRQ